MSNLSDLIPAGGGQNNTDFVADGTIVSGKGVILTAAGKAAPVGMGPGSEVGTPVVFEAAATEYISTTFDSDSNKVVVAYRDSPNSDYGTAIVGTVSGTSISYGTAVVYNSGTTDYVSCTFDSNSNKVVIAYRDIGAGSPFPGTAIVGTVSGTSISFGTAVVFNSDATSFTSAIFDSSANKVVIAYQDNTGTSYGTAIVGTVSGTSISFGTPAVFEAAGTTYIGATFDSSNNKVVIGYKDEDNSGYGTAIVGTVSGTSISFGSDTVYASGNSTYNSACYDSVNDKTVIAYRNESSGSKGTAVIGTVSGTGISFGTAVAFTTGPLRTGPIGNTYDTASEKAVISYADGDNSDYGTVIQGTVSGTSISFGSAAIFESAATEFISSTFDSNSNKVAIGYQDEGNSSYGTGVVYSTTATNMTAANLLGIASAAIADTETGTINTWGSRNEVQTGLTIASDYYVQGDGTITTASASPAQLIGEAITATQINIKDYTG